MRTIYGKTEQNELCPFVGDIPENIIEEESTFGVSNDDTEEMEFLE